MKRASYRHAIEWVAYYDSAADEGADDPLTVSELITSVLLADLFDVPSERVGKDVVAARHKLGLIKKEEASS